MLIEDGVLRATLSDRQSAAAAMGVASGGAARADGFARQPIVRMTNVSIEPGEGGTLEELIADVDGGIYMETNRSWSIDDRRLHFQFGTEIGREIRDGQLGRLVRNPTYAGVTPQFWALARRRRERAGVAAVGRAELREGRARTGRRTSRTGPRRRAFATSRSGVLRVTAPAELALAGGRWRACPGEEAQATVTRERSLVTRFARSAPTQATSVEETWVDLALRARRSDGRGLDQPARRGGPARAAAARARAAAVSRRAAARATIRGCRRRPCPRATTATTPRPRSSSRRRRGAPCDAAFARCAAAGARGVRHLDRGRGAIGDRVEHRRRAQRGRDRRAPEGDRARRRRAQRATPPPTAVAAADDRRRGGRGRGGRAR